MIPRLSGPVLVYSVVMTTEADGKPAVAPHPPLSRYYEGPAQRRRWVRDLFDGSADDYEWITRVMSFGSGAWYRREALKRAGVGPGMTVLDVCMGSGQVSRAARDLVGPHGVVLGLDASLGMLRAAAKLAPIPRTQGLVEQLPVRSSSVDFVSMGYALRHAEDLAVTFREYLRVLRPGGGLLLLEFTRPRSRASYVFFRAYLNTVVPAIARVRGSNAHTMMRYFWDTIETCVPPETILAALAEAGFEAPSRFGQIELFGEYTASKPQ